jgi:hypothetical protein
MMNLDDKTAHLVEGWSDQGDTEASKRMYHRFYGFVNTGRRYISFCGIVTAKGGTYLHDELPLRGDICDRCLQVQLKADGIRT